MSSLSASVPSKLSPAPVSTVLASAAVQRVFLDVEKQPAAEGLFQPSPQLQQHAEAILMSIYINDDGFEAVSTYSIEDIAAELRRRAPSRWTGKAAAPPPNLAQVQACPHLRLG